MLAKEIRDRFRDRSQERALAGTMQLHLLGSAAASAAVRRASRRTRRRAKSLNGWSFSIRGGEPRGAVRRARGGRAPLFQLHRSG